MTLRVSMFYAHPSGQSDTDITRGMRVAQEYTARLWKEKSGGLPITVKATSGKAAWMEMFDGASNPKMEYSARMDKAWTTWCDKVVFARDAMTGKPRFNLFVVPGVRVGRATALIVERALAEQRAIFSWDRETGNLTRVTFVTPIDATDWQTGWQLFLREPEGQGVI